MKNKIFSIGISIVKLLSIIFFLIILPGCSDMMNNYSIKEILTNTNAATSPVTYTSMIINNNDVYTYSRNAAIQLNVTDAVQMQFSDDAGSTWTSWEPYSNTKTWKLKLGTSTKTIQGRFRKSDNSIIPLSDNIVFCERLIASDDVVNNISEYQKEGYGRNLAISSDGKILAVAQPWDTLGLGHYTGSVYIYTWNAVTETWVESKINTLDTDNCRSFGSSIALSSDGSTLAVSDYNNISGKSVYLFKWTGIAWSQIQKIIMPVYSLALSGNGSTLIIGDPSDNQHLHSPSPNYWYNGAIYIYEYDGAIYNGIKYIPSTGDTRNGSYVTISNDGNTVISIPEFSAGGITMFIYRRNSSLWDASEYCVGVSEAMSTYTPKISLNGTKVLTGGESHMRYLTWDGIGWSHNYLRPSDETSGVYLRELSSNNSCTKFIASEFYYNHFHLFNYVGASWESVRYDTPDVYDSYEFFGSGLAMSDSGIHAVSTSRHKRSDGEYIGEIFIYRE